LKQFIPRLRLEHFELGLALIRDLGERLGQPVGVQVLDQIVLAALDQPVDRLRKVLERSFTTASVGSP